MNQISETFNFFYQFCRHPRQIGSLCPSSQSLCEKMISGINWGETMRIAELGAGNGTLTKMILRNLNTRSKLDAFEINLSMLEQLQNIKDEKLTIIPNSAEAIKGHYSLIISGLPFISFSKKTQDSILSAISNSLCHDGTFILFQYTPFFENQLSHYFSWDKKIVFNNVPPAFVYRCKNL